MKSGTMIFRWVTRKRAGWSARPSMDGAEKKRPGLQGESRGATPVLSIFPQEGNPARGHEAIKAELRGGRSGLVCLHMVQPLH